MKAEIRAIMTAFWWGFGFLLQKEGVKPVGLAVNRDIRWLEGIQEDAKFKNMDEYGGDSKLKQRQKCQESFPLFCGVFNPCPVLN